MKAFLKVVDALNAQNEKNFLFSKDFCTGSAGLHSPQSSIYFSISHICSLRFFLKETFLFFEVC